MTANYQRPRARYQGREGDRVQTRDGVAGIVRRLTGSRGPYHRVVLKDGRWLWPNEVIAESSGPYTARCGECFIEFRAAAPTVHTCPNCVAWERRAQRPDYDSGGNQTFARLPAARKFTRGSVMPNATSEQRERIERGRVSDDEGVPF